MSPEITNIVIMGMISAAAVIGAINSSGTLKIVFSFDLFVIV